MMEYRLAGDETRESRSCMMVQTSTESPMDGDSSGCVDIRPEESSGKNTI